MGIEALLRWQRTEGESRLPMKFIPSAEDTGEIVPIGLWVLEQACCQACCWDATGVLFSSTAVHVSAVQLRDPEFATRMLAIRAVGRPLRLFLAVAGAISDPGRGSRSARR